MDNNRPPEYKLSDNPHGIMFFGPDDSRSHPDSGADFTLATTSGYYFHVNNNGNSYLRNPGKHDEVCGDQLDPMLTENIAKSIVAKNGDIMLIAENGNLKIRANNIYIETTGPKNHGTFQVAANGQITLASGDNVIISGTKLCLRGQAGVDIASSHTIKMLGDLTYGSPLSALPFLPKQIEELIQGILESCK